MSTPKSIFPQKAALERMNLHDVLTPSTKDVDMQIIRVPGGWVYRFFEFDTKKDGVYDSFEEFRVDSVFVPEVRR